MKKRKLKIKNIILILLIIVFLFSITKIVIFLVDLHNNRSANAKLIDKVIEVIPAKTKEEQEVFKIDFDKLQSINQDTVGWIRLNQDKVNNPIVQAKDNDYYLNRSFEKKYNQAGAIFMDYRNTSFDDKNVVIFGHSMLDDTMFGSLNDIFKDKYFDKKENKYIQIYNKDNELLLYQIFSYYIIEKEEYYITTSFSADSEFQTFIDTISKRSHKKLDIEVSTNDTILTLSTCYGTSETSKRRVVHAKRIDSNI